MTAGKTILLFSRLSPTVLYLFVFVPIAEHLVKI